MRNKSVARNFENAVSLFLTPYAYIPMFMFLAMVF